MVADGVCGGRRASETLEWDGCVGKFAVQAAMGEQDGVERFTVLSMLSNRSVVAVVGGWGVYHVHATSRMDDESVRALSRCVRAFASPASA
eukprot:3712207-Rhodomonas_salina.2